MEITEKEDGLLDRLMEHGRFVNVKVSRVKMHVHVHVYTAVIEHKLLTFARFSGKGRHLLHLDTL